MRGRISRAVVVGGAATAIVLGLHATGLPASVEDTTVDARFHVRGSQVPSSVVLVALDERSFDVLGQRPPLPRRVHAQLLDRLREAQPRVIAYDVQFTEQTTQAQDWALWKAVSRARPVVLATADVTVEGDTRVLGGTENVKRAGGRVGIAVFPLSRRGVYRRIAARRHGLETFPVVAAKLAGVTPRADQLEGDGGLIDYAGPAGTIKTVSFSDVLEGGVPDSVLRGKVVVVGFTALSQADFRATPVHDQMPGAEIQANAIATVLAGFPLRDASAWVLVLTTLLLALAGAWLALRMPIRRVLLAGAGLLALATVGAYAAFASGVVVAITTPMLGLCGAASGGLLARHIDTRTRETKLRTLLSRLAPDRDVERLLARVEEDELVVLAPGAVWGAFEVDEVLGVGGMGVVHRARHVATGRTVALKVMSVEIAAVPELQERFAREARAAATLDHPGIVCLYEAGQVAGRPYLAMALVEGPTLNDLIGLPELTPGRVAEILGEVASALDYAHARGIVHRDVKPGNVLIDAETGKALLADFGIAHVSEATRLTHDFVGTAAYAAPDQIRGDEVTPACDQYALGCMLFECLTGRVPFAQDTIAGLIQAHLAQAPPSARTLEPWLGEPIDAVITQALAKYPTERFESCSALMRAAEVALAGVVAPDRTADHSARWAGAPTQTL